LTEAVEDLETEEVIPGIRQRQMAGFSNGDETILF